MSAAAARPLAIAWADEQPRTAALAGALGGEAVFVTGPVPRRPATAPLRYAWSAVRTWRRLEGRRPSCVVVVAPPVAAPLLAGLWCWRRRRPLVVDCHTGTFYARRWAWARPLYRWLLPHCRAVLVHTDEALALVRRWGAPGLLLPDDLPGLPEASEPAPATGTTVLVAGSLDENEPAAEALAAAALLPDVPIRVTGDPARLPRTLRDGAPPNVTFTGLLPLPDFLHEMQAAAAVAVFSTDPHIMNRAAFEAVGLGRPLVLSDLAGLRERFGAAALFAANRPAAMADAVRQALASRSELECRSQLLAGELRQQHAQALNRLSTMLAPHPGPALAGHLPRGGNAVAFKRTAALFSPSPLAGEGWGGGDESDPATRRSMSGNSVEHPHRQVQGEPSTLIPPTPGSPEARRAMGVSLPHQGGGSDFARSPAAKCNGIPRRGEGASKRVLRITQHPFPADSIVRRDVLELTARGFDVDVVCAAGPGRDDPAPTSWARPRVYRIPIRHRRGSAIRYLLEYAAFFVAALAVTSVLGLRRRYAAVQVDNLPDHLVFAAAVPRVRGARLVFTMYELTPEMVGARFHGRVGRALVRAARLVEAAATRWADHVIVVSQPCLDVLLARGMPRARTSVVLNTTSWNAERPAPMPGRPESSTLITHTTLVERYGVHMAIHALALLRGSWPELTLRIVGDGEQMPALVRLVADLGLDDRVVFTGRLPWSETLAEVSRARLGIVPVLADGYGEMLLPTKLLEYAWLGIPAVCSRLPAIEAYFPTGAVAYARPGDAEDLAAQVDRLVRQPAAAEDQARRASGIARELAWEGMRDRYLESLGLAAEPAPDACPAAAG